MRHGKSGKKLSRTAAHRKALFRNMVTSLLQHERIVTTEVKAKEIGRLTEKMITLGKRGGLHARRQAISVIRSDEAVRKLFGELAERYRERAGGYTRTIRLEPRTGDNAPMSIVELVDRPIKEKETKEAEGKKAAAPAEKPAPRKAPVEKAPEAAPEEGKKAKPKKAAAKPAKAEGEKAAGGGKAKAPKKPAKP